MAPTPQCAFSPVEEKDIIDLRDAWPRPSEIDTLRIIRRTARAALKLDIRHPREVLATIADLADSALGRERQ